MCDKNAAYARSVTARFAVGESPDDFPEEHYETQWAGRFRPADLNPIGRRALCLDN